MKCDARRLVEVAGEVGIIRGYQSRKLWIQFNGIDVCGLMIDGLEYVAATAGTENQCPFMAEGGKAGPKITDRDRQMFVCHRYIG